MGYIFIYCAGELIALVFSHLSYIIYQLGRTVDYWLLRSQSYFYVIGFTLA